MSVMVTAMRCSSAVRFTYTLNVYTHCLKLFKILVSLQYVISRQINQNDECNCYVVVNVHRITE